MGQLFDVSSVWSWFRLEHGDLKLGTMGIEPLHQRMVDGSDDLAE